MPDGILRSFLVDLGFRIDEPGLRRFTGQVQTTHHVVRDFAVGVAGMAASIEEAIRRTARQFDNLFYLSQQTRTSANILKGVQFAFEQIGLSSGEASATLAGFASGLRDNPGLRAFVSQYVPAFRTGADALQGLSQRYATIIRQFGQFSAQEAQYRAVLRVMGLDPDVILRSAQNLKDYNAAQQFTQTILRRFGLDSDDAAKRAVDVTRGWGRVWETITTAFQRLTIETFPVVQQLLDNFTAWFEREGIPHVKTWADNLKRIVEDPATLPAIERALENIGTTIGHIVTGIEDWIKKEDGLGQTKRTLTDIADIVSSIATGVRYLVDHPVLAGLLGGGAAGGAVGGPVGAILGAVLGAGGVQTARGLPTPREPALAPGSPFAAGSAFSSLEVFRNLGGAIQDISRWIFGTKHTPWVKVENTTEPITITFAQAALDGLRAMLTILFGEKRPGEQTEGGTVAGIGEVLTRRMPGRLGGMGPRRPDTEAAPRSMPRNVYEAISRVEGTFGPQGINYNMMQGGRVVENLVGKTLSEVLALQRGPQGTPAAGGFQIQGDTMRDAARGLKLDLNATRFSPEIQRQMADWIRVHQGFGAWRGFDRFPAALRQAQEALRTQPSGPQETPRAATGMDPQFTASLNKAFSAARDATGQMLTVFSGFRDHAKQMRLWLASDRTGHMVARPGHSMHEHGLAADIRGGADALRWIHQHAREFGLNFPMGHEPWHIEPLGARGGSTRNININSDHRVEINANGSQPNEVAAEVRRSQDRHSMLHARNLSTAVV